MKPKVCLFTVAALFISASCTKTQKEEGQDTVQKETKVLQEAGEIYIASGAGYRKPVNELKSIFEAETHLTVHCIFGNMKQVTTQVRSSGKVSLVIGDGTFLDTSGIRFEKRTDIGRGRLVLAFDKRLPLSKIEDIDRTDIDRIILPDPKKAIYGRASDAALKKLSLYDRVKTRLVIVQTVPQVTSYLVSGTAKVGFINRTDFLSLDQERFASIEVAPSLYEPITIEAALTQTATAAGHRFFEFVRSDVARNVFSKYGLGRE